MAGGNWTQLTISLANFHRLARSPAGLCVRPLLKDLGGLFGALASPGRPPPLTLVKLSSGEK